MTPKLFADTRKEAGYTQAQLAEHLDVSRRTVINWEKGVFAIPDEYADKLRQLDGKPKQDVAITLKSHPEFYRSTGYKNTVTRNHRHPHWFVTCTQLHYHMEDAQVEALANYKATTADIEKLQWTPERAITYIMQFDRAHGRATRMSRERAEEIARSVGFDIPKAETPIDAYRRDWADYQRKYPNGGWRMFDELYPQHRESKAVHEATEEEKAKAAAMCAALDEAFKI